MALAGPGRAETLPSGGRVAQGKASIAKTGPGRMQIRQKSKSAVVNWQGFSIGRADRVDIDQPSRRSAILNRVTGKTKSSIRGQLTANGKVYLVNPNGIEITQTGKVKANAFVGSTLDISDRDFARGKGRFAAAGELAAVRNAGVVEARSYAALLGGEVENSGVISAELGTVGLGSGRRATLKFPNGMLAVALPASGDGEGALIDSSGALRGERVEIRAAAAREAARQAVNLSGVIEARSVTKRGGAIVISGGGGEVAVSGRLDASARRGKGGAIEATGDRIRLAGARLDASGPEGGGQINIGGGLRGEGPLPRARLTSADAATVISADATRAGDGGAVVVWSDVHTAFAGRITARGGREGGDGGFAEVSGKRLLSFTGTADLSAARGAFGTLLLDPFNVTISDEISVGMDQAGGVWSPNVNDSNLNATQVETLLATANVTVTTANDAGTQAGDIDVLAPLEWTTPTILSLQADGDISLLSSITAAQGVLDLSAGGDIATSDSAVIELAQARWSAVGDMTIAALLTVQDGGFGAGADMSIAGAGVALGTSGLSAVGSMGISAPVTATSLTINAGELAWTAADDLAFNGQITAATGRIDSGGSLSISGVGADLGTFTLAAASDVQIAAPIAGDDLTIIAGGDGNINTTAAGSIEGGTLTLSAGNVISAEGAVDVDLFLLQAGAWTQNTTSLPAFEAGDFRIVNGLVASFLRVLGGNGGDQPYLVADVYGLQGISGFVNQNFALSNNIDASGTAGWNDLGDGPLGFLPIQGPSLSAAPLPFTGDFDGAGATIDGLTITRDSEDQVGLFARLGAGAQVTDLTLTNVSVTGGYEVGGIAGRIDAGATVSGSTIAGAVTLDGAYYSSYYASAVGGVAGVSAGSILDSTSAATVTGAMGSSDGVTVASAGGLVGESSGSIAGSSASGPVSLTGGYGVSLYAGGLAGSSSNSITDSSASGAVTATGDNAFAGGLVGGSTGSIAGSSATGTATASGYFAYAGGLVGGSTGSIADSSATGAATASGYYAFAGGLVGDSQGAITGSSASGAVSATGSGYDYAGATAGGLAGRSAGSILDSTSSSSVTASVDTEFPGGSATAGGLVGDNQGTITDAAASGTVSAGSTEGGLVLVGGLAGRSIDAISGSTASGGVTGEISGGTLMAGGLVGETLDVGETAGTIDDSSATGDVTGSSDAGGSVWVGGLVGGSSAAITASFATGPVSGTMAETGDAEAVLAVGGLAGVNVDAITDAFATGAVTATADGDGVGPAVSISAGGLVGGTDDSAIERAFASGAVLVQGDDFDAAAGGLVGQASGSIEDAFATGDVASVGGSVGGLVGLNQGSIDRTYAIGAVSDGGDGAGGLVGLNDGGTVDGSFWDTVTSGTGFSDGGTGLLTAEFQDTAGFFAQADAAGWDFDNVWAPSSAGFYPEIYTINPVVRVDPDDATREYGLANPTFTFGDPIGGPGTFLFGPDGDDDPLDYAGTLSSPADENSDIGAYDILASGNITSPLGQVYRATTLVPGTLTVTPATLTVDVGSDSKVYGDTYDFGDLDYTVNGLRNGDTVTVSFSSDGAAATAEVGGYDIDVDAVDGQRIGNYVISPDPPVPGTLTVTPATLTIDVGDDTKVYGDVYDLGDVDYTVNGLRNGDTVTVSFSSNGARATAGVADFDINVNAIDGERIGNYVINPDPPVPGTLSVTPAPLTITVGDDSKVYGERSNLGDVDYTVSGLRNDDVVDFAVFTSNGAAATASVGDYDILLDPSSLEGLGLANYYLDPDPANPGTLTVTPAPLTLTADDQTKRFGKRFVFAGDEFSVAGLRNADRVNSATLSSEGAPGGAAVGDYDIDIGAARGIGLGNYAISYETGTLAVESQPAPQTNVVSLLPQRIFVLPNPPDEIVLAFATGGPGGGGGVAGGGRPPEPLGAARPGDVLAWLADASTRLEAEAEACRQSLTDADTYLACLGVALDGYAAAIDARLLELPPRLHGVAATIRAASAAVRRAGETAARRLATAGSDAEVEAIEREAIETALAAVQAAAREVRASITLLRADEPQLASVTEAQGEEIADALDSVADGLIRAVGL